MQDTQVQFASEGDQRAAPTAEEAACCASNAKAQQSHTRRWLLGAGAVAATGAGLYGGWDWLVASGAGAILLGLAPCIAMCALGLCMGRGKK